MKKYQYGYKMGISPKKTILGIVDEVAYPAKKKEIDSANFVSSGRYLGTEPDGTEWFIEKKKLQSND